MLEKSKLNYAGTKSIKGNDKIFGASLVTLNFRSNAGVEDGTEYCTIHIEESIPSNGLRIMRSSKLYICTFQCPDWGRI